MRKKPWIITQKKPTRKLRGKTHQKNIHQSTASDLLVDSVQRSTGGEYSVFIPLLPTKSVASSGQHMETKRPIDQLKSKDHLMSFKTTNLKKWCLSLKVLLRQRPLDHFCSVHLVKRVEWDLRRKERRSKVISTCISAQLVIGSFFS